jgi:hypothetical protein
MQVEKLFSLGVRPKEVCQEHFPGIPVSTIYSWHRKYKNKTPDEKDIIKSRKAWVDSGGVNPATGQVRPKGVLLYENIDRICEALWEIKDNPAGQQNAIAALSMLFKIEAWKIQYGSELLDEIPMGMRDNNVVINIVATSTDPDTGVKTVNVD